MTKIRTVARLDEATDDAPDVLAEHWEMSRPEVLRKTVKERAKKEGLI